MKEITYLTICTMLLTALIVGPALGTDVRTGQSVSVPSDTRISDDLAATGNNVSVAGKISGDAIAAGNQVNFTGGSIQNCILAGSNVVAAGTTEHNLYAAGGQVNVSTKITDNAYVAGGNITITKDASVKRDLLIAGGTLNLDGRIGRDLRAAGGDITIDGTIGGDAKVDAGTLHLGPSAIVRGDLIYTGGDRVKMDPGAQVIGRTIYHQNVRPHRKGTFFPFAAGLWLFSLVSSFIVGAVLIALAPNLAASVADTLTGSPGRSLLAGLIFFAVVPVALLILMITIVGIPLIMILFVAYLISVYISHIFAGLALGKWLTSRSAENRTSLYLDLLVGMVILWLLMGIPCIGWFVNLAAIFLGLGAMAIQRYNLTKALRAEGRI